MPRISLLETVGREVRSAARTLLHSPVFTVTSLLILAICIGANTALFSVVDAVLLRPLPYPEPERLGEVIARYRTKGAVDDEDAQTGQTWFLLRDHTRAFDTAVFSGISSGVNFAAAGRAEYVQQERVGAGFFRVLGVPPLLGREFSADEDRPGGAAVAVLSHPFWSRVFHSDPAALGRAVMLGGEPHVIVGVMPPGFTTPATGDLWTPLRPSTDGEGEGENYSVIARLRPGATWEQAASEVAVIGETALRERLSQGVSARLLLLPLQRGLTASVRAPLLVLWAAAIVVLLIGCVNIAGLLLARAAARTRELATRLALGAARLAVLRQLLAESLLLSLGGGLGGLLLAFWALRELRWMAQDSLHLWQTMTLDGRVLGAALGVSILTSLAFGLLPAFRMSRIDLRAVLGEGGRGATDGGYRWARRLLVVAEVALGVVLLVSAGLLLRSFAAMRALQPGFEAAHVMTAQVSLQDARYATRRQVDHLFTASLERLRAVPGVEAAAVGLGLPYERHLRLGFQLLDGPEAREGNTTASYITPDFFAVLRVPLVRGRLLRDGDGPATQQVAVVNQAFVRRYLADREPLGRRVQIAGVAREIVGVVGDVQQQGGWGGDGPIAALPAVFFPASQAEDEMLQLVHTWFSPSWVVRTSGAPEAVAPAIQRAVEAVDPQLPIARFRRMDEVRREAMARQRFQAILLAALAGPALLLAALGIYGLIAYSVVERTREVGIRLALGATRWQTLRAVAMPGILLSLAGILLGSLLARVAVGFLQHLIWGVRPTDPATFAGVALGLLLVATAASLLPTLRLAQIHPAETLRAE